MNLRNIVLLSLTVFVVACSEDKAERQVVVKKPNITSLQQCDRTYGETQRTVPQIQSESTYLKYDHSTGRVQVVRGDYKSSTADVTYSMDRERFYEMCSPAARKVGTAACPYYIECVSQFKQHKERYSGKLKYFDFEDAATFLRKVAIESGELQQSFVEPHRYATKDRPMTEINNVDNACEAVSSTYSSQVLAATIFGNVPEVPNFKVANELAEKAIKGYGTCYCVLADYLDLEVELSIGACRYNMFISY